ncbi:MAG: HEPN domain-containing protein [Thermomicrobiales bacterium]
MDPRTEAHLRMADRNRDLASILVAAELSAPPYSWAVVVAFYAAMHYVNAYLWEKIRIEPRNHDERSDWLAKIAALKSVDGQYGRLRSLAFSARYDPFYQINRPTAESALLDIADIERAVRGAI